MLNIFSDTLHQTGTFKDHSVVLRLESDIAIGPHRNVPNSPDKEGSSDFRNNKTGIYSGTSMARTPMARLPRLVRTSS